MVKRYKEIRYIFKDSIEIYEHLDGKYGAPGEKRRKKKEVTPEQIKNRNQWNKERKARHKLKANFKENDWLVLLTYKESKRPVDMKMAKKHFSDAMRRIREEYKKRGVRVKWIRNIEVGPGNGWHVHLIINRIADTDLIVEDAWIYGKTSMKHLYKQGEFADLAGYITKTPETAKKYKENLVETSYSCSRNLPTPEPKSRRVTRWKKEPKPKPGYYLDKESYFEGINPATGYKYRYYTMVRIHRRI